MKAWLPYVYQFNYVPRNRKRPVWQYSIDTVEVDVPEISVSETDPVASVEYILWRPGGDVRSTLGYRSWNGCIISPVTCDDLAEFSVEWLPSAPDRGSVRPQEFRHLYGFASFDEKLSRIQHYLSGDIGKAADRFYESEAALPDVLENRREADRSVVGKIAADLVAVDGKLWHRNEGLCLRLDTRGISGDYYLGFHPEPHGYISSHGDALYDRGRYPGWTRTFDHSQLERAMLHAGGHGIRKAFGDIEVFDEAALSFDGERDFLVKAMDYAVFMSADAVGDMSGEVALAWTGLRSAVEVLTSDATVAVSDEDIGHFKTLAENCSDGKAEYVDDAFSACMDYLNDPWGRYGSTKSAPKIERMP